ncbi:sensor histidine kinase [Nocardioides zhouii]|uniref:sensor histidine kinase n=1 Tax=Nocardioides zhouii TaxID=1168729 RepID=UPI001F5D1DFD|nr:HAMP domain-containing sensor histidine kinase [Nocardioides zhouii]
MTLTTRLVALVVLLVAVTAAVIGTATTLVMRGYFTDRLDDQVRSSLTRAYGPPMDFRGPGRDDDDGRGPGGQSIGTLTALVDPDSGTSTGTVLEDDSTGEAKEKPLSAAVLDRIADVPADGKVHEVTLRGLGEYRVIANDAYNVVSVAGLPTKEVDDALAWLVTIVVVVSGAAVAIAGGAGTFVVRRQLAPLREVSGTAHRVAELPLASGEIDLSERVPARLTDERTEVGQVGAALNAMLDHVEASLDQRHRSEQQVRQFVADASHELRTPLATIAGYTELARNRPETTPTALAKVETESARMTGLVEDLLLLARLDSGRPLEREPVDLSRLLLEAVNDARVVDADRQWRLSLPDAPVSVVGDAARLHQVVTNLLANASKYTPAGTTITVTGSADGFTVHDDGPGFSPELAPRAFERFTRGDAARTRAGGAGLGLSMVQAIVAAHGGSVELTSNPGATTFTVHLPR